MWLLLLKTGILPLGLIILFTGTEPICDINDPRYDEYFGINIEECND